MPAGLDGNPNPVVTPARTAVVNEVSDTIEEQRDQLHSARALLVAIDGIDGAGKSTFADELGRELTRRGRHVVRSTIDSFHRPRLVRKRKGERSAIGFYEDSHDLTTLRAELLEPMQLGTGHRYRTAVFDEPTDAPIDAPWLEVRGDEVLLFDGIFLQRPELAHRWDLTIFLDGRARVELNRLGVVLDDVAAIECRAGSDRVAVAERVLEWVARMDRYASGMQIYLDAVDPMAVADVVIDNNDLHHPSIAASRQQR